MGVGEDVRGIEYLSSDVHVNYTKHEAYINIAILSVIYFLSSAAIRHLGKTRE